MIFFQKIMKKSSSISGLPSIFTRVNDVPLIMEDNISPSRHSPSSSSPPSSPSSSKDVSAYFKNAKGRVLELKTPPVRASSSSSSSPSIGRISGLNIGRIGSNLQLGGGNKLQQMIKKECSAADEARKIVTNGKKKAPVASTLDDEEKKRKALKHTSIKVTAGSSDEESFSSENEDDRAFIDDEITDEIADSEEGEESSSEDDIVQILRDDDSSSQEEENDVTLTIDLEKEDEENAHYDALEEEKEIETSEEEIIRRTTEFRKFLKPISMTYVPGLSTGGYGVCTLKNMILMLLTSAMENYYTYIELTVPRVQAILTATAEYKSKTPLSKGSTEGTVMAYRLWLHTREKLRVNLKKVYNDNPEMLSFLEMLASPNLLDSFFIIKKDFPVENCLFTDATTDVGFEIVSCVDNSRVSVLWFNPYDEEVAAIAIGIMRFWFLPFTLRSFVETYVHPLWPKNNKLSPRDTRLHYLEAIQPMVYRNIVSLIDSLLDLMLFSGIRMTEKTELSYN